MHLNSFTTETKLPLNHAVPAGVCLKGPRG